MALTEPWLPWTSTQTLVGREAEGAILSQLVQRVGLHGGSLAVEGEAGMGKTALLECTAEYAADRGVRLLRASGVRGEQKVTYSGLGQLLLPTMPVTHTLPQRSHEALRVAFGHSAQAPPPQRVLIALAELLRLLAADAPLLLVVDDFHWMDPASSEALTSWHREYSQPGVGLLVAQRTHESAHDLGDVPRLTLAPLPASLSAQLVRARHPYITDSALDAVLAHCAGNPLALREVPAAMTQSHLSGTGNTQGALPVPRRVEALFGPRLTGLTDATRQQLLVAAVTHRPAWPTVTGPGQPRHELHEAEAVGLVRRDQHSGTVAFSHPLVRATIIKQSTSAERRAAHRLLAQTADEEDDYAQHVWASTVAQDEIASWLLEHEARRAVRRGEPSTAVTDLVRAADLSTGTPQQIHRLAQAAVLQGAVLGDLTGAERVVSQLRRLDAAVRPLALVTASCCVVMHGAGDVPTAYRLLSEALSEPLRDDHSHPGEIVEALNALLSMCLWAGRDDMWAAFHAVLRDAQVTDPLLQLRVDLLADPVRTAAPSLARLEQALEAARHQPDPRYVADLAMASVYVDRGEEARMVLLRLVAGARNGTAVTSGLVALMLLSLHAFTTGRWLEADQLTAEGAELCRLHGYRLLASAIDYTRALLAAGRGEQALANALCSDLTSWGTPRRLESVRVHVAHVQTLLALGAGDFATAYRHARSVNEPGSFAPHAGWAPRMMMDLVESAVLAGHHDAAAVHVRAMRAHRVADLSDHCALLVAGSEAMAAAELDPVLFDRALSLTDADRWPFELARIELRFGQRLRRQRQMREARVHLVRAMAIFDTLSASGWVEQTRAELEAATSAKGADEALSTGVLTPRERLVAELAAAGLTNKEIAERLLISPRTVGAHLHHIFDKLNIGTRALLSDALADTTDGGRQGTATRAARPSGPSVDTAPLTVTADE